MSYIDKIVFLHHFKPCKFSLFGSIVLGSTVYLFFINPLNPTVGESLTNGVVIERVLSSLALNNAEKSTLPPDAPDLMLRFLKLMLSTLSSLPLPFPALAAYINYCRSGLVKSDLRLPSSSVAPNLLACLLVLLASFPSN